MKTPHVCGDAVAYSRQHLRSIADYSHDSASRRGIVIAVCALKGTAHDLIRVQWANEDAQSSVLSCNLVRADRLHLEPR